MKNEELLNELRLQVLACMESLEGFVTVNPKLAFPAPHDSFKISKDILANDAFNLVVCGKVKNGKSSLINALLGRELLPVNSDTATSQVFRITDSEEESFTIVYVNGDEQPITHDQLVAVGSQAAIDEAGDITPDKAIAYIQVNTKVPFLPKGVSIVDTPGIGATYPQHTRITVQFMEQADAALYVMTPSPLETVELDFLEEVVKVTPNLMFVTSQIDTVGKASVTETIERNTQILVERFGKKLYLGVNIKRMSSKLLMKASEESKMSAAYLRVSQYDEVREEISRLILIAQSYYRSGIAYNEATKFYNTIKSDIERRMQISRANAEQCAKLAEALSEAKKMLSELGPQHQNEIMTQVNNVLKAMYYSFSQLKQPKSALMTKYATEIDNLESEASIMEYSATLAERLNDDLQSEWNNMRDMVEKEVSKLLQGYSSKCEELVSSGLTTVLDYTETPEIEPLTFRKSFNCMRNEIMFGTTLSMAGHALGLTAIPVVGPMLALAVAGTVLWGFFSGQSKAKAQTLEHNKTALKNYVVNTIVEFNRQFADISLKDGKYSSFLDGYSSSIKDNAMNSMRNAYNAVEQNIAALQTTLTSTKQGVPETIMQGLVAKWEEKGKTLQQVRKTLESIKSSIECTD